MSVSATRPVFEYFADSMTKFVLKIKEKKYGNVRRTCARQLRDRSYLRAFVSRLACRSCRAVYVLPNVYHTVSFAQSRELARQSKLQITMRLEIQKQGT